MISNGFQEKVGQVWYRFRRVFHRVFEVGVGLIVAQTSLAISVRLRFGAGALELDLQAGS